jgi:hypothetical protein
MADALQSARIKLKRANLHAGTSRREAQRFFDRQTDPILDIKPYGEQSNFEIGSVFKVQLMVITGWPDLPDSFSARFGDAIHNYRSALDHVAWRLVTRGQSPPSTLSERRQRWINFPAYAEETRFDGRIATCLPGVDPTVIDWIKRRNKYDGGNSANDALVSLVDLSNNDKHRTLTAISAAPLNLQGNVAFNRCRPIAFEVPNVRPALKDDAVLQRWECQVTGLEPNVTMQLQPSFDIAIEGGRGFGHVLADIQREVSEILNAPEILAAVA